MRPELWKKVLDSGRRCLTEMLIVQRLRQHTRNLIGGDCFSLKMPIRSHSNMRSGGISRLGTPGALLYNAGFFQIGGRLGLSARADLDVIDDLRGTGGPGHASSGAFMLNHICGAFPRDHSVLDMEMKTVFADFGFGQLRLNRRIDLRVSVRHGRTGRGAGSPAARFSGRGQNEQQAEQRKDEKGK